MNRTVTNIKLLSEIKKQLDSLEDAFYDGIPSELLQNQHLTQFTYIMELTHSKIINLVKNSISNNITDNGSNNILQTSQNSINQDLGDLSNLNINYSQLEVLGNKK